MVRNYISNDPASKNEALYAIYIINLTYSWPHLRALSDLAERLTACIYSLLIGAHGAQLLGSVHEGIIMSLRGALFRLSPSLLLRVGRCACWAISRRGSILRRPL
jgi:hypothetical protein